MSRVGWIVVAMVCAVLGGAAWYSWRTTVDLEQRLGGLEVQVAGVDRRVGLLSADVLGVKADLAVLGSRITSEVGDLDGRFEGVFDELLAIEDELLSLTTRLEDLEFEFFFSGFGLGADVPAPVTVDMGLWCAEYEVALRSSAAVQVGGQLTFGDYLELVRDPLLEAGCPAD